MMVQTFFSGLPAAGRRATCLAALLLLAAAPAFAQISYMSEGSHRQERRKFLKEAAKTEATYKDTHLNTGAYTFRKGEASRPGLKPKDRQANYYQFDRKGEPVKLKKRFRKEKHKRLRNNRSN